jgi:hypothetical protein
MTQGENKSFRSIGWGCGIGLAVLCVLALSVIPNALMSYLAANDDRFPPDMSSAPACSSILGKYLDDPSLVHPKVRDSSEYLGNATLSKHRLTDVENPQDVIVFFNSAPWATGHRNITLANGSARRISEPDFQAAVANGWRLVQGRAQ